MATRLRIFLAALAVSVGVGAAFIPQRAPAAGEDLSPATKSLFVAVRANDLAAVRRSLLDGADLEATREDGRTAIDLAVDRGYFTIAHFLLAWRAHQARPQSPTKTRPLATAEAPAVSIPDPTAPIAVEPLASSSAREAAAPATPAAPQAASPRQAAPAATTGPAPSAPQPQTPAAAPSPPPGPATPPAGSLKIVPPAETKSGGGFFAAIGDFFSAKPSEPTAPATETAESAAPPPQTPAAAPTPSPPPLEPATPPAGSLKIVPPAETKQGGGFFAAQPSEPTAPATETAEPAAPAPQTPAAAVPAPSAPPGPATAPAGNDKIPPPAEAKSGGGFFAAIGDFFAAEPSEPTAPATETAESAAPAPQTAAVEPAITRVGEASGDAAAGTAEPAAEATARPPVQAAAEKEEGQILGRITEFFTVKPSRPPSPAARETALAAPPPPKPAPPRTNTELVLGGAMRLGQRYQADAETPPACVEKPAIPAVFCIEPVDWPPSIAKAFETRTSLYRGQSAIVRYDGGAATQVYAAFGTADFDAIVDYFSRRFGSPGETSALPVVVIGGPDRKNRIARWHGPLKEGSPDSVLEVREIDDLRWLLPPDLRHGAVWLHHAGADSIFRHVSRPDFLMIKMRQNPN